MANQNPNPDQNRERQGGEGQRPGKQPQRGEGQQNPGKTPGVNLDQKKRPDDQNEEDVTR